jgi:hypothetical protein
MDYERTFTDNSFGIIVAGRSTSLHTTPVAMVREEKSGSVSLLLRRNAGALIVSRRDGIYRAGTRVPTRERTKRY